MTGTLAESSIFEGLQRDEYRTIFSAPVAVVKVVIGDTYKSAV